MRRKGREGGRKGGLEERRVIKLLTASLDIPILTVISFPDDGFISTIKTVVLVMVIINIRRCFCQLYS